MHSCQKDHHKHSVRRHSGGHYVTGDDSQSEGPHRGGVEDILSLGALDSMEGGLRIDYPWVRWYVYICICICICIYIGI